MKRTALAAAMALALAPLVYAALDVVEAWRSPEADPSQIIRAEHYAFTGRVMVTAYVTAILAFALGRARVSARALVACLLASSAGLLLEGALRG